MAREMNCIDQSIEKFIKAMAIVGAVSSQLQRAAWNSSAQRSLMSYLIYIEGEMSEASTGRLASTMTEIAG
jgi:hypothetical protein